MGRMPILTVPEGNERQAVIKRIAEPSTGLLNKSAVSIGSSCGVLPFEKVLG